MPRGRGLVSCALSAGFYKEQHIVNYLLAALLSLLSIGTGAAVAAGGVPAKCTGCDFGARDLHGADLRNVAYVGVDLSGANLRNADLRGAKLVGVDFSHADLRGANLQNARLTGVDLDGAQLSGAIFTGAVLTGINLRGVLDGLGSADARGLLQKCTGCDAQGAEVAGFDLSGVAVVGADLSGARAARTRFTGAELEGVDLANADLRGADFRNAKICTRNDDGSSSDSSNGRVHCIDLRGADVAGADFRGALYCESRSYRICRPVDAATLRAGSRSDLSGAILQ
ncbi:MAG TPA: pentapeptide repeat-containing protein [Candidatus Cybelea sp.]